MTNAVGEHANQEIQTLLLRLYPGETARRELADSWQQQIADHRLVVIGATGLPIFLLAGSR